MMTLAKKIGKWLAYLQDTIDILVGWLFHKIRLKTKKDNATDKPLKKTTKSLVRFLAQIGDTFYQEYTDLKKRHSK